MRVATPRTTGITSREQSSASMRSLLLPNVPVQPTNGMIRTYENQSRTFSRPYSAKTVFFYKEGDEYFTGVRVPISKQRYRTIDSLLDDLNRNIQMPFGVRRLTTPMGRTPIEDIDQLEHLGKYVATSSKYSRGINLSALERLKKARMELSQRKERAGGQSFWIPNSPSYKAKLRLSRTLGLNVIPSKQVFFILNGKMNIYRTLLNPLRLPTMEQLLAEVSEGLQVAIFRFYTTDGQRILNVSDLLSINPPNVYACPRNERLNMRSDTELPVISNIKSYGRYKSGTETSSSGGNGIEKTGRFESALRRNTRKRTGAPMRRFARTLPIINTSTSNTVSSHPNSQKRTSSLPDETDSGKANSISSRQTDNSKTEDDDYYGASSSLTSSSKIRKPTRLTGIALSTIEKDNKKHPMGKRIGRAMATGVAATAATVIADKVDRKDQEQEEEIINEGIEDASDEESEDKKEHSAHDKKQNDANEDQASEREDENERAKNSHEEQSDKLDTLDKAKMIRQESELSLGTDTEQDMIMDESPLESAHSIIKEEEEEGDNLYKKNQSLDSEDGPPNSPHKEEENIDEDGDKAIDYIKKEEEQSIEQEKTAETVEALQADESAEAELKDVQPEEDDEPVAKVAKVDDEQEQMEQDAEISQRMKEDHNPNEAATTIQAAFRGYYARKLLKIEKQESNIENDQIPALAEDSEHEMKREEDSAAEDEVVVETTPVNNLEKKTMYTVQIQTGNRWGSETESDLYIILHGDDSTSERLPLQHEATDPRFQRNQNDFFHVDSPLVGTINKIVIGHEESGYGAGIFIGYVIVTENILEGRQFFFSVNKWFDSGQVDGKIERMIPVSAFYYVNSIPDETVLSQGRWEFVLHSGTRSGTGGTTSDILIYGYGMEGSSVTRVENDVTLKNVPSTSLVQVDFGAIGELVKVRFEIIPLGDSPDYFLEYVELRDLDTEERLVVRVGKWLDVSGEKKNPQAFREIGVYRAGVEGLHVINYEGRVQIADFNLLENNDLSGQLIGAFDSGVFPLFYNENKKEYTFKVECVDLGRVTKLKVIGNFSKDGEAVMEGFSVLQDIWDCYAPGVSVADNILATQAYVRESTHCPYRYVLSQGKVMELEDSKPYFKTLQLTAMEGLSTKFKKEQIPTGVATWCLDLSIEENIVKVPDIWLISGFNAHLMSLKKEDANEMTYELKTKDLKTVDKVRIFSGQLSAGKELIIKKMRLVNKLTKQIVRFPNVDTEFCSNDIFEYSTVYPDISPKPNITYVVSVNTSLSNGSFLPVINLIGADSDSGVRQWGPKRIISNGLDDFEIDAVNLGEPKKIELTMLGDKKSSWSFEEIRVTNPDTSKIYKTNNGSVNKEGKAISFQLEEVLS